MPFWNALAADRLLIDVSLWSADLAALGDEVRRIAPFADMFHIDVSDAHFVPGLLFFPDLVAALRPLTAVPFHVHLMVEQPADLVQPFADAGADLITVHIETGEAAHRALAALERARVAAGLALRLDSAPEQIAPFLEQIELVLMMGTELGIKGVGLAPEACDRMRAMQRIVNDAGQGGRVKVFADGGLRAHTVPALRAAGADGIAPGSLIFGSNDLAATVAWLHALQNDHA